MSENIFANVKKGTPVEVYAEWQDGLYVWHAGWAFQGMSGSEVVVEQTGQPRVHGTFRGKPQNVRLATGDGIS
jgi:hypothetical protein